jgi:23S rRNA (guanosine2251-2'-O)-methyltransferase
MPLELRNPHSVLAAMKVRPHDVLEIRIRSNRPQDAWQQVCDMAVGLQIPIQTGVVKDRNARRAPKNAPRTERVGAAEATVREPAPSSLNSILTTDKPDTGLWLALDCVQDPQNVGAIFRSASFFGIRGIIMTRDRSSPMNGTVCDVAAGGVEDVPFVIETNLARALDKARQAGLWILGASEHAEQDVYSIEADRAWLLVVGNEQKGLRRLTLENCDVVCRLAPVGAVTSLNVSVATGALIAVLNRPSV